MEEDSLPCKSSESPLFLLPYYWLYLW
jgi:hypothetical protein